MLLTSDGAPRLADFGIALVVAAQPAPNAGRGSPYSMSPQQAAGAAASVADDIYGFGAMLYELLSGYPPLYGDGKLAATTGKTTAALPAAVPEPLARLVAQLLAESPADRPTDMESVERELAAVLAAPRIAPIEPVNPSTPIRVEPPNIRTSSAQGEPLRGEWQRSAPQREGAAEWQRQGFRRGLGAAAVVLGIAAVAVVFFVLPRWVEKEQPARYVPAASSVPAQRRRRKRRKSTSLRSRAPSRTPRIGARPIDERLKKLTARAADQWGGEEFRRANEELAAGDKDYEAREYITALEHFTAIEPLLTTLEKRAGQVLADAVESRRHGLAGRTIRGRKGGVCARREDRARQQGGRAWH